MNKILFIIVALLIISFIHMLYFDFFFKLKGTTTNKDVIPNISDVNIKI